MDISAFQIRFKERMTIVESMCLNLLWCIVFGSRTDDDTVYTCRNDIVTYHGDLAILVRMHRMLIDRNWKDTEFDENRNSAEVQAVMQLMVDKSWGTFDERLKGLLDKIEYIGRPARV